MEPSSLPDLIQVEPYCQTRVQMAAMEQREEGTLEEGTHSEVMRCMSSGTRLREVRLAVLASVAACCEAKWLCCWACFASASDSSSTLACSGAERVLSAPNVSERNISIGFHSHQQNADGMGGMEPSMDACCSLLRDCHDSLLKWFVRVAQLDERNALVITQLRLELALRSKQMRAS